MNNINCFSVGAANTPSEEHIPEQCKDCFKLKECSELGVLKDKECKSKNVGHSAYDPLGDFAI